MKVFESAITKINFQSFFILEQAFRDKKHF